MDTPTKSSTLDKLLHAINIIETNQDKIMSSGTILSPLWDEILHPDILGSLCPTAVLTRAFIAQIKVIQDEYLRDTILEYLTTNSAPKRTKAANAKEWFDNIKKQLSLQPAIPVPSSEHSTGAKFLFLSPVRMLYWKFMELRGSAGISSVTISWLLGLFQ